MILPSIATTNIISSTTPDYNTTTPESPLVVDDGHQSLLLGMLFLGAFVFGLTCFCLIWLCVFCRKNGYSMAAMRVYTLKNVKFSKGKSIYKACTECITEFKEDEILTILPCSHTFHPDCLRKYVRDYQTPNCPICLDELYPRRKPGSKNLVGTLVTDKDPLVGKKLNYGTMLV